MTTAFVATMRQVRADELQVGMRACRQRFGTFRVVTATEELPADERVRVLFFGGTRARLRPDQLVWIRGERIDDNERGV